MSYTPPLDGFKPSLFSKIAEVQGELDAMSPDEKVVTDKYSYTYISESQLLTAIRAKLSQRSVAAFVSVDSQKTELVEMQKTGSRGAYTVAYAVSEITLRIVFADGDSGETFTIYGQGRANDSGDKSLYKAITSANRYAWWKTMLVPTGDDDVNKSSHDDVQYVARPKAQPKDPGDVGESAGAGSTADGTPPPPDDLSFAEKARLAQERGAKASEEQMAQIADLIPVLAKLRKTTAVKVTEALVNDYGPLTDLTSAKANELLGKLTRWQANAEKEAAA